MGVDYKGTEGYKMLKEAGLVIDLDYILERIKDPNNWTDDFLDEVDEYYTKHFNEIRNTLVQAGQWSKFDTVFSEWKRPGQLAVLNAGEDEKDDFCHYCHFCHFTPLVKNHKKILMSFPTEELPEEIRPYIEAVSESLQVPVDMVATFVLSILSLCIQGKYWLNVKPDWTESLNLYVVVVGRPSERKSPTLKETTKPVFKYVEEENEKRQPYIAEYELKKKILTGRLKNIQDALAKMSKKNTYTMNDAIECQKELTELEEVRELKMILDDVTPESLVKAMQENDERMGIISAEGGIFGMLAGRYNNNTNFDIFLKSYSGEYYSAVRIGREDAELKHPYLTICLAVQPQVISDIMENKDFRGKGLLARFLYSIPNTRVGERVYKTKPISPFIRSDYEKLIHELLDIPDFTNFVEHTIRLSDGADKLAEGYYHWIESRLTNELEEIEDWAGKLHGNTMRIAGILHVVKYKVGSVNTLLEDSTMKSAIEIGKYYLDHSKMAFDIMGLSDPQEVKEAKYIISRLETHDLNDKNDLNNNITPNTKIPKNTKNEITKRDLWHLCKGRLKSVEEMEPGLKCLEEHGYIAVVKEKNGRGRPSEKIYINPEYYKWKEEQERKK